MPRDSIITTVYNRPPHVLENTLRQLSKNNLKDTEVIVVDDNSSPDLWLGYAPILNTYPVTVKRVDTIKDRPDTYNIEGYNNPAYAWNVGLEAAQGERIMMLASDCMLQPYAVQKARANKDKLWMCGVADIDSGMPYLSAKRIAPYGWFMSWRREDAGEIRQDEEFLKGIAFDDNDFTARLALKIGTVHVDLSVTAFHQSHPQTAYSDGMRGHDINERYIITKWGGVPWTGLRTDPLKVRPYQNKSILTLRVTRKSGDEQKVAEDHGFV